MAVDGSTTTLRRSNEEICRLADDLSSTPGVTQTCRFVEAVMDGHKYVWVSNSSPNGDYFLDAFSIDNAQLVASIPTCTVPRHVEYAPHREELWLHCWMDPGYEHEQDTGQIAAYSTNALGAIQDKVLIGDISVHTHGNVAIDPSIPNYVFGLSAVDPKVHRIYASTRKVESTTEMPNTYGLDENAFSAVNGHFYFRTYTCCACGESIYLSCDESTRGLGNVTVTNGPDASDALQLGYCGHFCRASRADTQGVIEYDAINDVIIGQHYPPSGSTGMQPFATPSGDLLFMGIGDGESVMVLKAGENGKMSTNVGTITLPFGVESGNHGTSDLAVVTVGGVRTAVFTSTLSNTIGFVDLSVFDAATESSPVTVVATGLDLHDEEDISSNHDVRAVNVRRVRWATDTNYIWVDSTATDKLHVVQLSSTGDFTKAKVLRTIDDIDSLEFVFVRDYPEQRIKSMISALAGDSQTPGTGTVDTDTVTFASELESVEEDVDSNKKMSLAAIVVSSLALVGAIVALATGNSRSGSPPTQVKMRDQASESTAQPEVTLN